MSDAIRDHIRKILHSNANYDKARDELVAKLEADGRQIITGGQTGVDTWEIIDWRTGKRLAAGGNGLDGYDDAAARLDPEGRWRHIDVIEDDIPLSNPRTNGIPSGLATALQDWIDSAMTTPEEIAEVAAIDVAEVRRLLGT
jgi:hypothetical protein